jgi:two-component system, OmpR family, sensor histidine kinase BaeS
MTLRARLFVTGLLVAVPLAMAFFVVDTRMRLATKEEELRQSIAADVAAGLRDRCEADPPRTGRPGRGGDAPRGGPDRPPAPRGTARGPGPADDPPRQPPPGGPPRTGGRRGAGQGGGSGAYQYFAYDASGRPSAGDAPPLPAERDGVSATTYWTGLRPGIALVVPLGGDGPCAFLLARIPPRPAEVRDQAQALLLVVVSVLAAAWIAAGPLVGRLRRLASSVQQSAASHYETPVTAEGDDEVAALAGAFNDAGRQVREHLVEVQAREESLRSFVANTTHDVAIPLSVLLGHLAELDRALADPAQRDIVRGAVQEAHYMASLLRNLGAATRLEDAGAPLVLSPVDLSALVEQVVERHRPMARASGVDLNAAVPESPITLVSDHTLLEQALGNLVDNAVRYNHPGGHVAVVVDRRGDDFVLSVEDDGPGVSEEDLARLTTRWFRGSDARTRRPGGKGLGLAIAHESLSRLGFALEFQQPPGGGLRAEIRGGVTVPR